MGDDGVVAALLRPVEERDGRTDLDRSLFGELDDRGAEALADDRVLAGPRAAGTSVATSLALVQTAKPVVSTAP